MPSFVLRGFNQLPFTLWIHGIAGTGLIAESGKNI